MVHTSKLSLAINVAYFLVVLVYGIVIFTRTKSVCMSDFVTMWVLLLLSIGNTIVMRL